MKENTFCRKKVVGAGTLPTRPRLEDRKKEEAAKKNLPETGQKVLSFPPLSSLSPPFVLLQGEGKEGGIAAAGGFLK